MKTLTLTEDTLYHDVMRYLDERAFFVDELAPPVLCSIGASIANKRQKNESKGPFWFIKGVPEDLRVPLAMIAPSGGSKSYMMKFFVRDGPWGLMHLHSGWEGKITEAGFVGTKDKEGEDIFGSAREFSDGILAFHEITNLFITARAEHSGELVNQVMEALSEGKVHKRLSTGPIGYNTGVTIWGGVQPARFDMTAGLMRRFMPVAKVWSPNDLKRIQIGRRDRGRDERYDMRQVESFRREFELVEKRFDPENVVIEDKVFDWMEAACQGPHAQKMVECALGGKATVEFPEDNILRIRATQETKELIQRFTEHMRRVSLGSDLSLLVETVNGFDSPPTLNELFGMFNQFNYTYQVFDALLRECIRMRLIFSSEGRFYTNDTKGRGKRQGSVLDTTEVA